MPQFNFKSRFAPAVAAADKRQTVRATRKHRPRVGQTAYCFTGLRTTAARRLGAWPIIRVLDVEIYTDGNVFIGEAKALYPLTGPTLEAFAQNDGFANADEFVGWIARAHGLPFLGTVTYW